MRIVSWNLGHQTHERPIKAVFRDAIEALAPDVLVLNEYVDGETRTELKETLRELGLEHVRCATRIGRHNQVLIASRTGLLDGTISSNGFDETASSNLLNVAIDSPMLEVVGFRTPAYTYAAARRAFWTHMDRRIRSAAGKAVVFIGDVNADPNDRRSPGGRVLSQLAAEGWRVPSLVGEWSYCGPKARARIDHAVISPSIQVRSAAYWPEVNGRVCAGRGREFYDHAPLTVDLELL